MPSFKPEGVCATQIDFQLDADDKVHDIHFTRGCPGNAVGLARLAEGRSAEELIELFKGLPCGQKSTSCPDQLARALAAELAQRRGDGGVTMEGNSNSD